MIKTYLKKIILLLILFVLSTALFSQDVSEDDNEDKIELKIKYVEGKIYIQTIGKEDSAQGVIGQVLGIDDVILVNEKSFCVVESDGKELTIVGPVSLRAKDINLIKDKRIQLNNIFLNSISNLYLKTNREIAKITNFRNNFNKNDAVYQKAVKIGEQFFFETAFSMVVDLIENERNTIDPAKKDPQLFKFFYLLAEISYQSLNLNIAESSIHIITNETEPDGDNIDDELRIEIRQKTYILASIIHTIKFNYDFAVDYLEKCLKEFSEDDYFRDRTGYLINYLLGLNYMIKENYLSINDMEFSHSDDFFTIPILEAEFTLSVNKDIKSFFAESYELCNTSIDNNIKALISLLRQERTELINQEIGKYFHILNEASVLLGYLRDIDAIIGFL